MQTDGGVPVLKARFAMPRQGVWTGDVELMTPELLAGKITLQASTGVTFVGTIVDSAVVRGVFQARIVGGGAGLPKTVQKKYWEQATAKSVLSDIVAQVGETLSSASDAAATATVFARWAMFTGPASFGVDQVANELGATWRVQADGTIWVGTDTFPTVPSSGVDAPVFTLLDERGDRQYVQISCEDPWLLPGVTFLGQKVGYVEHLIGDDAVRTEAYFE